MDLLEPLLPREKMLLYGIEALSDVELLALFLRTGTREQDVMTFSHDLLARFGSLYGLLSADKVQFDKIDGIGLAKFAQLKGVAELARRYFSRRIVEEPSLVTPLMTREFLQSQLMDDEQTSHPYYWAGFAIIGDGGQALLHGGTATATAPRAGEADGRAAR